MAGEETTNQGNIKVEYNNATTGLNLDQTVNQISKGKLTYALNAAVENFDASSVNYQNEPGNEFCLNFPDGYQLIGEHSIPERDKHIFYLANPDTGASEIGYMFNNDCIYQTLVNAPCLNFDINYPIHKTVHKITNCTTEIYWTDGLNPRRWMDIDNVPYKKSDASSVCDPIPTNELDCNQIKVQPNFEIPELNVVDIRSGGDLLAGTYQFAIQYCDPAGNAYTSFYSVTNPTPIADIQKTTPNFNYAVGKSIKVRVSNLDLTGQFQYFNLAVIKTVNAITSVELIGTYFIEGAERSITYTGQNKTDVRLTVDDIFEKYPYYEIAQDITAVRDILVWDNLTSIDRINYQQIANGVTLQWQTYKIPASENYSDELNATNLRGYLRDEVYAFEIVFLLRNGKQTDGFHIPGRAITGNDTVAVPNTNADFIGDPDYYIGTTGYSPYWKIYNTASVVGPATGNNIGNATPYEFGEFAYWQSEELYPCNKELWGDLASTPIRHHKFPDVLVSPIFESAIFSSPGAMVMQSDAVFPIGVKLDISQVVSLINSSNLTQEQKDEIAGFKIVRGDRGTNKSIVGKGILRNVGKYEREGTEYYYPNYPYNDINKDPFLLDKSNAYTANNDVTAGMFCRSFAIEAVGDTTVQYTDCFTNTIATLQIKAGETVDVCALDFPKPTIIGNACVTSNTYKTYKITARGAYFNYYPPTSLCDNYPLPAGYDSWCDYCFQNPTNLCCNTALTERRVYASIYDPVTGQETGQVRIINSITPPLYDEGDGNYTIEEIGSTGYEICAPKSLDGFSTNASQYRQVFNSPETSFGQPFLGNILKLENVIYGAGKAHFTQVNKNALYKMISKEAQQDALVSANDIADITTDYNAVALFAAYQAYLTIYINGITRRNYAWSFNSIASYDYSSNINNNVIGNDGYLGIKQREIDIATYLIPAVQGVGDVDGISVNNWQRESSVFLKTVDKSGTFQRVYNTYRICNVNILPNTQVFSYTDITTGTTSTLTLTAGNCSTISSYTYPELTSGNTTYTVSVTGSNTNNVVINTPALAFPDQTPSIAPSGTSLVTDDSRFVLSDSRGDCNKPGRDTHISTVCYYASLKNISVSQYGQIYSYDTVDTGFQRDITPFTSSVFDTVFGGDTFISRFTFKTKLPFFIDNRVGAPDDSDIYYDEIGNVAYPTYWYSARSVLTDASVNTVTLKNFISIKAHNLDCPNSQTPTTSPGRTFYDGKMYLFAYGVPNFYCESSYNVDLRQAFNNKEGDFWPHVTTGIPDDWVQESNVSIANDNTYYYNVTFSKQNRENTFTHLPADWTSQLCYTYYPFRAVYSDSQEANADNRVNNWLTYRAISFYDFPQNYGDLTSLDGIQNKAVLARFENKSLLYNTLLTVQTSNPQAAYLGNDTLFRSAPPVDFAETDLGYVGSQNKMLLKIPQGQITIDAKRGQVFLLNGNQATDLSAFGSGMNRFFTDHLAFEILRYFPDADTDNHFNGLGLHGVFDSKYDRVIITKLDYIPRNKDIKYDDVTKNFYLEKLFNGQVVKTQVYLTDVEYFCNKSWTLSFNMNTQSWISFHSYIPNFYIAENNFFYSGLNDCCSDFEAVVAEVLPEPSTTTTTTSSTSTTSTSTTSTTTTLFVGCDLEGEAVEYCCNLLGVACDITPTTTTTTTLFPCEACYNYLLENNSEVNVFVAYYECGAQQDTDILVPAGESQVICACQGTVIDPLVSGFTITEDGACVSTTTTTTTISPCPSEGFPEPAYAALFWSQGEVDTSSTIICDDNPVVEPSQSKSVWIAFFSDAGLTTPLATTINNYPVIVGGTPYLIGAGSTEFAYFIDYFPYSSNPVDPFTCIVGETIFEPLPSLSANDCFTVVTEPTIGDGDMTIQRGAGDPTTNDYTADLGNCLYAPGSGTPIEVIINASQAGPITQSNIAGYCNITVRGLVVTQAYTITILGTANDGSTGETISVPFAIDIFATSIKSYFLDSNHSITVTVDELP